MLDASATGRSLAESVTTPTRLIGRDRADRLRAAR
jgi:hypothetical protein